VNLTDAFLSSSERTTSSANNKALKSTLSQYGWCHVAVDPSRLSQFRTFSKAQFVKLFEKGEIVAANLRGNAGALYRGRTAESGSSLAADPEPKQSWEVQRCGSPSTPLHEWMNSLHSIAVQVTKMLSLPENTFLQESACQQQQQQHHEGSCSSSSCCGDSKTNDNKCNVDLLRIFLYDPVHPALGSSPHTDWGSWTVVWQDDIGGLQTYCPLHETYVDVKRAPASAQDDGLVYFVVHVGDVTSLALGHAAIKQTRSTSTSNSKVVTFPSPKHRVVCPQLEPRVSLVYFAYPPPSISLAEMETRLEDYSVQLPSNIGESKNKDTVVVSYDSYYLLQNQTPGGEQAEDPEEVYRRIRTKPLGECFRAKWEQVQRIKQ